MPPGWAVAKWNSRIADRNGNGSSSSVLQALLTFLYRPRHLIRPLMAAAASLESAALSHSVQTCLSADSVRTAPN